MTSQLVEVLISGISNASVYALMALGLALIYGVTRVFNFAHGSLFSLAGYLAWLLFSLGLGYPAVFAIVIPAMFLFGVLIDRFIIRPVRIHENWSLLVVMTTLALAVLLDNLYLALFGPFLKALPPLVEGNINLGDIVISLQDLLIFLIAVFTMALLLLVLNKTRQGMAIRAVAQDMVGAEIVGIRKNRVFSYTFAIATVLAGVSGILLASRYFVSYKGGFDILVKAWVITAVGGMGSLLGAVIASLFLAIVEALVFWQFGAMAANIAWFAILVGVFIVRPRGIRGTWE